MFGGGQSAADGGHTQQAGLSPGLLLPVPSGDHAQATMPRAGTQSPDPRRFEPVVVSSAPTDRQHPANPPEPRPTGRRASDWVGQFRVAVIGVDLAVASLAAGIGYAVTAARDAAPVGALPLLAAVAMPFVWAAVIAVNHGYEGRLFGAGQAEFERVFRAFVNLAVIVAGVSYAAHAELPRSFVAVALPSALVLDLAGRYAARKWLHRRRAHGEAMRSVLAVGDAKAVLAFTRVLTRDRYAGLVVRGACLTDPADPAAAKLAPAVPHLGDLDAVLDSAGAIGADTVAVVSSSHVGSDRLRWIAWQLEGTDVDLVVSPGLAEVTGRRLHIRPVAGLPLLHVEQPAFRGIPRLLKGTLDRVVALLALIVLAPLLVGIYLAVRATSDGPALFRQVRVGRDGETFTILKFRSMYTGAEGRVAELLAQNVHDAGPLFKIHDDPRITRLGRVLRRYSLDELPQLINVLAGQMSLVGPRPPLPSEVLQYADDARRRLLVKPGLTGLWQVSGRSDLSWEESVQLDLRYVENWSPALDLMILWKTAFAVARGSGAY